MGLSEFPFLATGIQGVVGVANALIASADVDAWATDPANTAKVQGSAPPFDFGKNHALWLELGAVGVGLVMEIADWPHPDVSEPLLGAGVTLLANQLAFWMAQKGRAVPATPQGMVRGQRVGLAGPATARPLARPAVGASVSAPWAFNQTPGSLA